MRGGEGTREGEWRWGNEEREKGGHAAEKKPSRSAKKKRRRKLCLFSVSLSVARHLFFFLSSLLMIMDALEKQALIEDRLDPPDK